MSPAPRDGRSLPSTQDTRLSPTLVKTLFTLRDGAVPGRGVLARQAPTLVPLAVVQGDPRPTLKWKGSVTEVGGVQPAGQKARLLDLLSPPPAVWTSAKHREPCLTWEQCLSAGTVPVFLGDREASRGQLCRWRCMSRPPEDMQVLPQQNPWGKGAWPQWNYSPHRGLVLPARRAGAGVSADCHPGDGPLEPSQGWATCGPPGVTRAGPSVRRKSSEFPTASALHLGPQLPGKGRVDGGGTRMRTWPAESYLCCLPVQNLSSGNKGPSLSSRVQNYLGERWGGGAPSALLTDRRPPGRTRDRPRAATAPWRTGPPAGPLTRGR